MVIKGYDFTGEPKGVEINEGKTLITVTVEGITHNNESTQITPDQAIYLGTYLVNLGEKMSKRIRDTGA